MDRSAEVRRLCVVVTGTRTERRNADVVQALETIYKRGRKVLLLAGCAEGVDSTALQFAKDHGWLFRKYEADYHKWGRMMAPRIRNEAVMAHAGELLWRPEWDVIVLAFPWGVAKGTGHAKGLAEERGMRVIVFPARGLQYDDDEDEPPPA